MKLWWCVLILTAVLVATCLAAPREGGEDGTDRKFNIDPALRKALLRALRHLKEARQEEEKQEQLPNDGNTTEQTFATTILDELLEESAVAEDTQERVGVASPIDHSTYVTSSVPQDRFSEGGTIQGEEEQKESGSVKVGTNERGSKEIIKTIIIAKPKVTLTAPKLESYNEIVPPVSREMVANTALSPTAVPVLTETTTATQTPIGPELTTPVLTHNEDGENIEQVKSEDVKIFQAPLVAAFTVQQDQLGVSRNVIPLLQTPPKQVPGSLPTTVPADFKSSPTVVTVAASAIAPLLETGSLSTRALEEKTRQLETQLLVLQNQQRAQEQLLRTKLQQEQAIIQQQQLQLQQQKQRLEEETRLRILRFEQEQRLFRQQQQQFQQAPSHFKPPPQQKQLQPAPQPTFIQELPRSEPFVQFISSVSLPGGKPIPVSVEQQLPFKEAVDFKSPTPTTIDQVKVPSQQPQLPQPPQLARDQALPLKPFQPFNLFPVLPPLLVGPSPFDHQQLPLLQQRNRVFRQEPPTGNFGVGQPPFWPSQSLTFMSGAPTQSDSQNLQNLLFQSGITSRSAEDLNIITKVLALNHGIPQASSQRMFAKLSPEQQRQLLFR